MNRSGKIVSLLLFSVFAWQNTYSQFSGGSGNGHAGEGITNSACSVTMLNSFAGGGGDGHTNNRITNSACSVTMLNPFSGGIADGHANSRVTNSACPITMLNAFSGGIADGHANNRITNTACSITMLNAFGGGTADGHSNNRITNVPCPIISIVPVELLYFNAKVNNAVIDLNWSTASEINNDYFTIEKTPDGLTFQTVGRTRGAGNSVDILSYKMTDFNPYPGLSYYRLKQTDFDLRYSYSDLVAVRFETGGTPALTIYPNPVSQQEFSLVLSGTAGNSSVYITLYNVIGEIIFSDHLQTDASGTVIMERPKHMTAGLYSIVVKGDDFSLKESLVIIK